MPFNPDATDIEWKVFALAIWIWVGTLYQIQPEAPTGGAFMPESVFIPIIEAHLSNNSNNSLCP